MSMTDVIFESESLSLELGFLELDPNDHRSTRWSVRLSIKHSTGCFSYLATDVWFDTDVWDEFTTGLSSQEPKILRLVDMSENFRFSSSELQHPLKPQFKYLNQSFHKG
ncbi:hypothetical protein [Rhizobium leguminosarum]|uniref:hypothetical protein n=1 Tax=Rhizobium leguminosarum TaxID=384 RepID=UPI001FE0469D|nr:hypothetical protein [Rhizobium leguminosarum]